MLKHGGLVVVKSWIKVAALALLSLSLKAQNNPYDITFSVTKATSLSTAAEVITVQHTATSTKSARFVTAYIYCSVACSVTLERGGTNATATPLTVTNDNPLNGAASVSTCTAYSASNSTSGTVINTYNLTAGGFLSIDASIFQLSAGILDNITFRTSAITGNVVIQAVWREL